MNSLPGPDLSTLPDQPRRAFLEFQGALMRLEEEIEKQPVDPDLRLLFGRMSTTCRAFFYLANRDLFQQQPEVTPAVKVGEK